MEVAGTGALQLLTVRSITFYKCKVQCLRARIQTFEPSLKIQTLRRSLVALDVDIQT
jgi:hypothetical protein